MISVTLRPTSPSDAEGDLQGHPCKVMVARTHRISPDMMTISLWNYGYEIGDGTLRAVDGQWVGECSEFAATWRVCGRVGEGRLEFSE